jgi:acyl-[acyl-carrier-protein]-phospholipid O-acyltransferase/long-chain-fatty-acid--[acyl-carrier-protein] ligase
MLRTIMRWLLIKLYSVELVGLENFHAAGERVLIVANHTSFLDAVLLWAFLPGEITFAINTRIAQRLWVKPALAVARVFPMEPTNPLAIKGLVHYLKQDRKAVIFPEGRITVTGALMKIYDGAGMIAVRSAAAVLPIRIDGAQYTPFSRLRGCVRLRWFPAISLNVLSARKLSPPAGVKGRERRKRAGLMLADLMTEMMFATSRYQRTLFSALIDARRIHGGRHLVLEDTERKPVHYHALITRACAISGKLKALTSAQEAVGLLLPSAVNTVAVLIGLQMGNRLPALLNFSAGAGSMLTACRTACIKTVVSSRRFIELARLGQVARELEKHLSLIYLEDLAEALSWQDKAKAAWRARTAPLRSRGDHRQAHEPAVILFTSGSEGTPKGVVLSHANLLANCEQLAAKIDFSAQDIILNVLPLFHSFGLTTGTLLPLLAGMRTFLYPTPLHYRIIPELAYDLNATILFGTNTFLSGYAKNAHAYDFYSVRYVFAGAEKLQEETHRLWMRKFGIRILEGYGTTETSPVLTANTPMHSREGSVGRFLPGIEYRLEPVPGVRRGGRLCVSGPNVMLGYLLHDRPGVLRPPSTSFGEGWYDTGDIVSIDEEGYVIIEGRAKRFAKVGGEMVSLAAVEELATRVWPESQHAAVALPDPRKGEQILLLTDSERAERAELMARAQEEGFGEVYLPKRIVRIPAMPLLATGKVNYSAVMEWVSREVPA